MQVRTTARFVDRERLAADPGNPDAADTPAAATLDVSAVRALELVDAGFADPVGIDRATLEALALAERQEVMAGLLASLTPASSPIGAGVDRSPSPDREPDADTPVDLDK